jgi:predicted small secreted protein|tara:strand:- start:293 stop:457 length:165 start_codon:yes stop_codon:yes gene_type:complete
MIRKNFVILNLLILLYLNACNTISGTATGVGRDIKSIYHYGSCVWDWDKDCQKK